VNQEGQEEEMDDEDEEENHEDYNNNNNEKARRRAACRHSPLPPAGCSSTDSGQCSAGLCFFLLLYYLLFFIYLKYVHTFSYNFVLIGRCLPALWLLSSQWGGDKCQWKEEDEYADGWWHFLGCGRLINWTSSLCRNQGICCPIAGICQNCQFVIPFQ
jgi:hypothetical protein